MPQTENPLVIRAPIKEGIVNPDDVPNAPRAAEYSYRRRPGCVVMRPAVTKHPEGSGGDSHNFLAYDTTGGRPRGPESPIVFRATIIMLFARDTSMGDRETLLRRTAGRVADDSAWLLRRAARVWPHDSPPARIGGGAVTPTNAPQIKRVGPKLSIETRTGPLYHQTHTRDVRSGVVARLPRV